MKARAAHAYRPAVRPEPPRTSPMSSRPAREAGESQSVASRSRFVPYIERPLSEHASRNAKDHPTRCDGSGLD